MCQNCWFWISWLIGVCATCCLLNKPKVSMMSLCSTAAPDCHTGQSKGRYHKRECSVPVVVINVACLNCLKAPKLKSPYLSYKRILQLGAWVHYRPKQRRIWRTRAFNPSHCRCVWPTWFQLGTLLVALEFLFLSHHFLSEGASCLYHPPICVVTENFPH